MFKGYNSHDDYGNADNDQGHGHGDDWAWIIYDKIEEVFVGFLK